MTTPTPHVTPNPKHVLPRTSSIKPSSVKAATTNPQSIPSPDAIPIVISSPRPAQTPNRQIAHIPNIELNPQLKRARLRDILPHDGQQRRRHDDLFALLRETNEDHGERLIHRDRLSLVEEHDHGKMTIHPPRWTAVAAAEGGKQFALEALVPNKNGDYGERLMHRDSPLPLLRVIVLRKSTPSSTHSYNCPNYKFPCLKRARW
jgi:hypothetical protein